MTTDIENILKQIRSNAIKKVQSTRKVAKPKKIPTWKNDVILSELAYTLLDISSENLMRLSRSLKENLFFANTFKDDRTFFVYPEGCKFLHYSGDVNCGVIVIEQPPQTRSIFIRQASYYLPIPYSYFVIFFKKIGNAYNWIKPLYFGFRTTPITSLDDGIHQTPFPNIAGNDVCLGTFSVSKKTPFEVAEAVIAHFWQSRFEGSQYLQIPFNIKSKKIVYWKNWEELNIKDILKATFSTQSTPITQLMRSYIHILDKGYARQVIGQAIKESYDKVRDHADVDSIKDIIAKALKEIQ